MIKSNIQCKTHINYPTCDELLVRWNILRLIGLKFEFNQRF